QGDRREPATRAERPADDQDPERLARPWDRVARDREARREVDEQGAGRDEEDVPDPGIEALADRDGNQEIGERQSAISSSGAIEPRDRDGHLDSGRGSRPP